MMEENEVLVENNERRKKSSPLSISELNPKMMRYLSMGNT